MDPTRTSLNAALHSLTKALIEQDDEQLDKFEKEIGYDNENYDESNSKIEEVQVDTTSQVLVDMEQVDEHEFEAPALRMD